MSDQDAPQLSEGLPLVAVINADARLAVLDRAVTCGYQLNARLCRSEVVVRGGVEPPTFAFQAHPPCRCTWLGCGLMSDLAVQTMAHCRLRCVLTSAGVGSPLAPPIPSVH